MNYYRRLKEYGLITLETNRLRKYDKVFKTLHGYGYVETLFVFDYKKIQ